MGGIKEFRGLLQQAEALATDFGVQPRSVPASDAVVVSDRSAGFHEGRARGPFDRRPAGDGRLGSIGRWKEKSEVEGGAVPIRVGKVAEHLDAGLPAQRVCEGRPDAGAGFKSARPGDCGLQGVGGPAPVEEILSKIGVPKTITEPLFPGGGAETDPTLLSDDLPRPEEGLGNLVRLTRGPGEHQAGVLGDPSKAEPGADEAGAGHMAQADGHRHTGFIGIRETQHEETGIRQTELPIGFEGLLKIGKEKGLHPLPGGTWPGAHRDLRDQAETTLRAHDQLSEIGPRGRGRKSGKAPVSLRRCQDETRDHVLDAAVAQALLSGRPGRHPAAQGRQLPGLGVVAQAATMGLELGLHLRTGGAGAEYCVAGAFVKAEEAVHFLEVQDEDGLISEGSIDASGHRGPTSEGDKPDLLFGAGFEDLPAFIRTLRSTDSVGNGLRRVAPQPDDIDEALAPGVAESVFAILRDLEIQVWKLPCRGAAPGVGAGGDWRAGGVQTFHQPAQHFRGGFETLILKAPSIQSSTPGFIIHKRSIAEENCKDTPGMRAGDATDLAPAADSGLRPFIG